jgi:hypothetical protein
MPGGVFANPARLANELSAAGNGIATKLTSVSTSGNDLNITFEAQLSGAEIAILDGGAGAPYGTHPAGGLLVVHNDAPSAPVASLVDIGNKPTVFARKPAGTIRSYGFGVNFCDRTTWLTLAQQVVAEAVGTGDGAATNFSLAHGDTPLAGERILDLYHGKIADEDNLPAPKDPTGTAAPAGYFHTTPGNGSVSGYKVIVKVAGVEKTERKYAKTSGGDYTLNYVTGQITFAAAPADAAAVTATYWYVPATYAQQGLVSIRPPVGKKWIINKVEVQYSKTTELTDTVLVGVFDNNGNALARPTKLKNIRDIISWTNGAFPEIAAHGGALRGITAAVIIQRWDYESAIELFNLGTPTNYVPYELRVWLDEGVEATGEWMSVVFYGLEEAVG